MKKCAKAVELVTNFISIALLSYHHIVPNSVLILKMNRQHCEVQENMLLFFSYSLLCLTYV